MGEPGKYPWNTVKMNDRLDLHHFQLESTGAVKVGDKQSANPTLGVKGLLPLLPPQKNSTVA